MIQIVYKLEIIAAFDKKKSQEQSTHPPAKQSSMCVLRESLSK